ncbi:hypothetical protein K505DRAFT_331416 [Melanomma pulvis-pyrius CBS 109.77]|uniref:Uncharacterized protein n=1 Tax=Melanomma pulvis-pyrius CBS 109.77 TaxID=1314802 RepID=A0A6A6XZ40_9PLEO|nr:hypothetical protein K505DRAFT_331416 [Melanomma pulvis-pyrius CBS 109.77]
MLLYSLASSQSSRKDPTGTLEQPDSRHTFGRNILPGFLQSLQLMHRELSALQDNKIPEVSARQGRISENTEYGRGQSYTLNTSPRPPSMFKPTGGGAKSVSRTKKAQPKSKRTEVNEVEKASDKIMDNKLKKRQMPQRNGTKDRACKVQKTDHKDITTNIKIVKKKKTGNHKDVPIELSDSDDNTLLSLRSGRRTRSTLPFNDFEDIKAPFGDLENDLSPSQGFLFRGHNVTLQVEHEKAKAEAELKVLQADYEKAQADLKALQDEVNTQMARANKAQHNFETQRACANDLQADVNRMQCDYAIELHEVRQESTAERLHLSTELGKVREEGDDLKRNLEAEEKRSAALGNEVALLQTENMNLKSSLEEEKKAYLELMKTINTQSGIAAELVSVKMINEVLSKDIESLKNSYKRSTLSPTPTLTPTHVSSSSEDAKIDNVRKTYIRVKMRYDNLYSIAKKLHVSTKGMGLSNFGEFGAYLRQLKTVIEDVDGQDATSTGNGDSHRIRESSHSDRA